MMRINRRYVAVTLTGIFLIILLIILTPFYSGYRFKSQYEELIALINRTTPLKVDIVNYSLGFASSAAELAISFKNSPQSMIHVNQEIHHGPYVYNPTTSQKEFLTAVINSEYTYPAPLNMILAGGKLQTVTVVTDNNYKTSFSMPPKNTDLGNQTILSLGAIEGTYIITQVDKDNLNFTYNMKSGPIGFNAQSFTYKVDKTEFNSEQKCDSNTQCSSNTKLAMTNLNFVTPGDTGTKITANQFSFQQDMTMDPELLSDKLKFNLTKTNLLQTDIDSIDFKISMNNFSRAGIAEIKKLQVTKEKVTANFNEYNSLLVKVFKPNSSLSGEASIKTSFGTLDANINLSFAAKKPQPKLLTEMVNTIVIKGMAKASTTFVNHVIQAADSQLATTDIIPDSKPSATDTAVTTPAASPTTVDSEVIKQNIKSKIAGGNDFQKKLDALVQAKKIPASFVSPLSKMYEDKMSPEMANTAIDGAVKAKQITEEAGQELKTIYQQNTQSQKDIVAEVINNKDLGTKDKLDLLVELNLINANTAKSLTSLEAVGLSEQTYNSSIDALISNRALSPEIGEALKNQYAGKAPTSLSTITETKTLSTPAPETGKARQQFDDAIKAGWVMQDGDFYVSKIEYENGILKVNDKVIEPGAKSTPTAPTTKIMPAPNQGMAPKMPSGETSKPVMNKMPPGIHPKQPGEPQSGSAESAAPQSAAPAGTASGAPGNKNDVPQAPFPTPSMAPPPNIKNNAQPLPFPTPSMAPPPNIKNNAQPLPFPTPTMAPPKSQTKVNHVPRAPISLPEISVATGSIQKGSIT